MASPACRLDAAAGQESTCACEAGSPGSQVTHVVQGTTPVARTSRRMELLQNQVGAWPAWLPGLLAACLPD